jgi:hypothetical protein
MRDEISRIQFYQRVQELVAKVETQPEQEPVRWQWIFEDKHGDRYTHKNLFYTEAEAAESAKICGVKAIKKTGESKVTAAPPAAKPEPPPEWEAINNIIAEYGLDAIAFVAEWKAAQRKPLTDAQAKTIAYVGPVFAPDGVVKRSAPAYRQELEQHRMDAIRRTEAAHNIKEQP